MLEKTRNFFYGKLSALSFQTDQEKYLYLTQFITTVFAAVVHVVQFILFTAYGMWLFTALNAASIGIYVICFLLIHKARYTAAGILLTLEISIYSTIAMILLGTDTFIFSYLMITLLLQMLVPYAGYKVRIPLIILIWVLLVFTTAMGMGGHPKLIDISKFKMFYAIFNVHVGIIGVIAEVAVSNSITKLIGQYNTEKLEKYRNQANRDMLTGLYNRHFALPFFEKLKRDPVEMEWCVAMLDIDDFKVVNDTYGHKAGDDALCAIADLLRANLRKTDIIFRWGGEEFLVFLMDVDLDKGYEILEKVREKLEESIIEADGRHIKLTATIGLAPLDMGSIETSIKESDKRLYEGKASGKNKVVM